MVTYSISDFSKKLLSATSVITVAFSAYSIAHAQQFDAPYYANKIRSGAQWVQQDKKINEKLSALKKRFGKSPNIIYILADDVGWGELGWQGGGKHRGTPTPELNIMAFEGMRFWSAYAEPSCTPTRIALNTGRHPVRTGLLSVLWPGQTEGLSPHEKTIAEILSDAGYHTAMWGKWHLGELEKHAPEKQGYDYAYYGLFNGAPDAWQASKEIYNSPTPVKSPFYDFPGNKVYKERTDIDLSISGYIGHKSKGRKPIEGQAGKLGLDRQEEFEEQSIKQIISYVKDKSKSDKPFFIYWATYAQQLTGSRKYRNKPGVDRANAQASMMAQHSAHVGELLQTLKEEGIAENTLVVWISDNGPMYAFWPTSGYTLLKGAKGEVTEGGIRVPAMAWWPGMIKAGSEPQDFMHVTDLFTTAARLAGVLDKIPGDRVTDGIDQTPLFLLGDGNSRRNYMFHYSGRNIAALRYEDIKILFKSEAHGGLPSFNMYNVRRDPGEKRGAFYKGLYTVTPLQNLMKKHLKLIKKFPHRKSENMPEGSEITPHD